MTDTVTRSSIPLGEIQHAALEHEVRTAASQKELVSSRRKSDILDTYRAELLQKVNAHITELEHLDESRKRTSVFKNEMMQKVQEHLEEIEKEQHKKEEVARIKEELMAKVHEHAEELERMDAKKTDLSHYKSELLARVDERAKEIEHAHEKEAQVHKFSEEMKIKVREHEAHLADRAKMMETVKNDVMKAARTFYGGAYCTDESIDQ
jgi:chromosome segregation ATPase